MVWVWGFRVEENLAWNTCQLKCLGGRMFLDFWHFDFQSFCQLLAGTSRTSTRVQTFKSEFSLKGISHRNLTAHQKA